MVLDATRSIEAEPEFWYRCLCGNEVPVKPEVGGTCEKCGRRVTPEKIRHDSALAMTLNRCSSLQTNATKSDAETHAQPSWIGRRMGHFEIIEPLGQGGMGQVYRALDHALQRYVALKVLRRGKSQRDERQIDLLLQEAIAQARVNHPNVATIYHVSRDEGDPFLAMELIDGGTLAARIKSGPLPFNEIALITNQIVDALHVSLQYDIIHGDIKPTNLLVKKSGDVKLSDFGMARSASKEEEESEFGGTPNYLSPELLDGEPPSIQSDMYALGVTLYELTFGCLPVRLSGSTLREWIDSHQTAIVEFPEPWPEHIPTGWRDFLGRLLAKSPHNRFQSYDEVKAALKRLQPQRSPTARKLPRLVAAGIDYSIVMLLWIPVIVFVEMRPGRWIVPGQLEWLIRIAATFSFLLPIVGYTALVAWWKQSIGRSLMQLRVVNRFGLTPTTRALVGRTILRMLPLWLFAFLPLVSSVGWLTLAMSLLLMALAGTWLLVDLVVLLISRQGKSLHDRLARTRVVWDTK